MNNYYLALINEPLTIVPLHQIPGLERPYALETIDAFTKHFKDGEELLDYLKRQHLVKEDMVDDHFAVIQVSKELQIITMEVRYGGVESLFSWNALLVILENLFEEATSYIATKIGWEIRNTSLMVKKDKLTKEEFISACTRYVCTSEDEVNYAKLRRLAMIVANYQQETTHETRRTSKLSYDPYWNN